MCNSTLSAKIQSLFLSSISTWIMIGTWLSSMKSPKEVAAGEGVLSLSSYTEITTRLLLSLQSLASTPSYQIKRNKGENGSWETSKKESPNQSKRPAGRIPGISWDLSRCGFPNRLSSRPPVWYQLHCGGLASISQASSSCLYMTSTVTLLSQEERTMDSATLLLFHSNIILLDLLKFRQPNEELQRWPGKKIILAGRCQDPKASTRGALWDLKVKFQALLFFSYKRQKDNWVYGHSLTSSDLIT